MSDPKSHSLQNQFFRRKKEPVKPPPISKLVEAQRKALGIDSRSGMTPNTSPYGQQNSARAGR